MGGTSVVSAIGTTVYNLAARCPRKRVSFATDIVLSTLCYLAFHSSSSKWALAVAGIVGWYFPDVVPLFVAGPKSSCQSDSWTSPLIYSAATVHTRLVPKKHSFSYSYLLVGVPVERENHVQNPMLTISHSGISTSWLSVRPDDHLFRTKGSLCLRKKLDQYLLSQNVDPHKYPQAYLVTAPRFLGYNFNPVSFWYLYSTGRSLIGMILEVNNTFDERRMYLLRPDSSTNVRSDKVGAAPQEGRFAETWSKDFHVSPFNDRQGTYTLHANDPLVEDKYHSGQNCPLSNTIRLWTPDQKLKLIAKVFQRQLPIDPTSMNLIRRLRFLSAWWWVGFSTFPRIVFEAGRLHILKQMKVWYRPEVKVGTVGRQAKPSEVVLERCFRAYIRKCVRGYERPLALNYITPMTLSDDEGVLREEIVYSQHPQSEASRPVTFQPLTPYFYSFLSLYLTTVEGINACLSHDVPENNLLYVSDLESVAKIFGASKSSISGSGQNFKAGSKSLEEAEEWQFLRRERQRTSRPPTQAYPVNSTDRPEQLGGKMSWSDLDDFVRSDLGKSQALDYRSATLEALEALETRIWRIGLRAIIGMIWSAIEVLGFPLAYASLLHWNMGAGNYKAYSLIGGLLFCGTFVVCYLEEKNPRQAVEP